MSATFQNRELVIPGDIIYEGRIRTGENTYRNQDVVIATRLGLVNYVKDTVSVIALQGSFNPMVGDLVIGEVKDIELGEWVVDIGGQIEASLSIPDAVDQPYQSSFDMTRVLDIGDTIIAKVVDLDRRKTPILSILGSGLGKVNKGFLFRISPIKIPRLIGKKGSMINMIIKETGCRVVIGQNGLVLIDGSNREKEEIVIKVIEKVNQEAHISGLTNRVQEFLKKLKEEKN
ncbi:S1 RNA-binding domain-containing protein [Candidatus Bathyarchaeota archaeon]|nr:S1 RNA-binding domain-containing protein [Candidatus Bathyarchaeota archaeon]